MIIGNNDKISVQGSTFNLAAFTCAWGDVAAQAVDLSAYAGQKVRIYLDGNLQLQINPREDMFWQLAEMIIPPPEVRRVQQGVVAMAHSDTVLITRTAADFDALPDMPGKSVSSVGFAWQNYQDGIEWQAEATGIRWIGERAPQTEEIYPVALAWTTEEPLLVSEAVPLDLTGVTVQAFELPPL